jgi:ribosomal protein L18E
MLKAISKVLNGIVDRYERESMENDTLFRDDIIELIAIFERLKSKINVSDINDPSVSQKIDFKNTLGYIITNRLADLSNSVYSKDNIKALNYVNSDDVEEVALREFKIFKFNNIVKATINLDKYLKTKIRNFINKSRAKSKVKMKKVKNILFDESGRYIPESIYNFIGDDNKVDICLCQIELESEEEISEALDELSSICKEFNNELNINRIDGVKSYYLINGCIAEIHLKDCTKLILTEEETAMVNSAEKPELDIYIEQLALFEACNSIAEDFDDKTLDEKIASIFIKETDLSLEAYDVIMDIFSLIGANKNQVDMFTESFSDYRNKIIIESADAIAENKFIKSIYNNWEPMKNVPYDIQVEAYSIFNDIIQEAAPKVNKPKVGGAAVKNSPIVKKVGGAVNKAKEKNNDYNPSENISNKLNNIKIYLQGLKSKVKGLGQKEKELSRQLDANYNNFAKAVKNAFISDRRESIIKGSVIPSFSKSIKIAIALAGLGIVTGNPIIPIAAALGGLAVSKKLTKRERILLLDEIETELEVVEKEIANADARNQIKKYRALLQYKKNLQRQYQRIKYNVRVGKDILPGSAAGFKERN